MQTSEFLDLSKVPFLDKLKKIQDREEIHIFLVGGCVRDVILSRELKDVDVVCEGMDYERLAKLLSRELKCRAVPFKDNQRLMKNGVVFDVSKLRGENLEEDRQKRDFTINNLACSLEGKLIGDVSGIEKGVVRHVYDEVFDDDPLRIMRGYRFLSTFGFEIDSDTYELMQSKKEKLVDVAGERIREELEKLLAGDNAVEALKLLSEDGIFSMIFGLEKVCGEEFFQAGISRVAEVSVEKLDVLLCLYVHEYDEKLIDLLEDSLKLSRKSVKTIKKVLKAKSVKAFNEFSDSDEIMNFIYDYKEFLPEIRAHKFVSEQESFESFDSKIKCVYSQMNFDAENLVTGKDVMDLGFKGADVGVILDKTKRVLVFGKAVDKETALKMAVGSADL